MGVDVSSAVCKVPVPLVVREAPVSLKVDIANTFVVGIVRTEPTATAPVAVAL